MQLAYSCVFTQFCEKKSGLCCHVKLDIFVCDSVTCALLSKVHIFTHLYVIWSFLSVTTRKYSVVFYWLFIVFLLKLYLTKSGNYQINPKLINLIRSLKNRQDNYMRYLVSCSRHSHHHLLPVWPWNYFSWDLQPFRIKLDKNGWQWFKRWPSVH